ncbi:DUF4011 domain-containing protein [Micromonospora endolithica]|uniref:DUF4011 domain-containing protein n=1 Tax=Micromonospora endolithica TaxID=230091 RepID=A0A3A9ZFS1_9ACTN|nr:DUF4011 domain-containing protein [Micromonospora endolithica]
MLLTQPDVLHLVQQAAGRWADQLIDFGPRNTLLYFKERQTTTLDLAEAAAEVVADLLRGQKVRLRTLFPDQDRHTTACNTARSLRRKLVELEEEQGIQAGWVTRGLVGQVNAVEVQAVDLVVVVAVAVNGLIGQVVAGADQRLA